MSWKEQYNDPGTLPGTFGGPTKNALVGSEAINSGRRILWDNPFLKNSREAIKRDMLDDSGEMLTKRMKEFETLKKKLRTS